MARREGRQARGGLPWLALGLAALLAWAGWGTGHAEAPAAYVGSEACAECHQEQFDRFQKHSKKAHSFAGVKALKKGLTDPEYRACLECHTTGYGQPGGFRSEGETPAMKNAGCEVCHGPGSVHKESQDPKDIKSKLTAKDCERCHNSERVGAFRYRPLLFGGAH